MSNKKKTMLAVGLTLAMLLGLLTGCRNESSAQPEPTAPARADRVSAVWELKSTTAMPTGQLRNIY